MDQDAKLFITPDIYLTGAVSLLLNIEPAFKTENGRTLFVFPVNDDLYRAMNLYTAGVQLNAFEFSDMLKRLRSEMLMRRGQRQG